VFLFLAGNPFKLVVRLAAELSFIIA
jgi:hypothetical protein